MRKVKSIPLSLEDISFIFDDNQQEFHFISKHCYCSQCEKGYNSTIINYTILLNSLYDIVLEGFCESCNNPLKRYIETGENTANSSYAEAVWKTNKALKELKVKKQK